MTYIFETLFLLLSSLLLYKSYDLENSVLLDRTSDIKVNASFSMDIVYAEQLHIPSYNEVMTLLYNNINVFHDSKLNDIFTLLNIKEANYFPEIYYNRVNYKPEYYPLMTDFIVTLKPKIVVELGVHRYHGHYHQY